MEVVKPEFFVVTPLKFILMNVGTFGIYSLFWIFKNWSVLKKQNGLDIWPFTRAVFAPLFTFSLFERLSEEASKSNIEVEYSPLLFGFIYFILSFSVNLPDPYWLITFLSILPILAFNQILLKLNTANNAIYKANSKIKGLNWLAVTLGICLFVLGVIETLYPSEL